MATPTAQRRLSLFDQFRSQLKMIVDFSIECKDITSTNTLHRLMPRRRAIDHRQTSMSKYNAILRIEPDSTVIWPTMDQRCEHGIDYLQNIRPKY
jgi:hypothetical protein